MPASIRWSFGWLLAYYEPLAGNIHLWASDSTLDHKHPWFACAASDCDSSEVKLERWSSSFARSGEPWNFQWRSLIKNHQKPWETRKHHPKTINIRAVKNQLLVSTLAILMMSKGWMLVAKGWWVVLVWLDIFLLHHRRMCNGEQHWLVMVMIYDNGSQWIGVFFITANVEFCCQAPWTWVNVMSREFNVALVLS